MNLDILTPLGQESAREEQEMLDSLRITFPDSMFVNTPKSDPAKVDGFTIKGDQITSCFESKCRKMTRRQLTQWGNEWLVTFEKIQHGAHLAKTLGVPFYGFLYLVPDSMILIVKIADHHGDLLPRIRLDRTETQRTINGGKIIRTNAYIDVTGAVEYTNQKLFLPS
jgi:hypothetical protein